MTTTVNGCVSFWKKVIVCGFALSRTVNSSCSRFGTRRPWLSRTVAGTDTICVVALKVGVSCPAATVKVAATRIAIVVKLRMESAYLIFRRRGGGSWPEYDFPHAYSLYCRWTSHFPCVFVPGAATSRPGRRRQDWGPHSDGPGAGRPLEAGGSGRKSPDRPSHLRRTQGRSRRHHRGLAHRADGEGERRQQRGLRQG